jgi:hypothetical protein
MDAAGQPRRDSRCPRFVAAGAVGRIENDELIEVSGPLAAETQGEAVGFTPSAQGYCTVSEGLFQPIHFFERK